jgi:hypothetical protein
LAGSRIIYLRVQSRSLKEPYLQAKRGSKGIAESVESMATKHPNVPREKRNSSAIIENLKGTLKNFAEERRGMKLMKELWKC